MEHFISPISLVALVPLVVEFLKQYFKLSDKPAFRLFKRPIYIAQLVNYAVAILLAMLGKYLNLGFFSALSLPWSLIWGLFIGLASNGAFEVGYLNLLHTLLELIKTKKR